MKLKLLIMFMLVAAIMVIQCNARSRAKCDVETCTKNCKIATQDDKSTGSCNDFKGEKGTYKRCECS